MFSEDTNGTQVVQPEAQVQEQAEAKEAESTYDSTMTDIRNELSQIIDQRIGESKISIADIMNDNEAMDKLTGLAAKRVLQSLKELNTKSAKDLGKPVQEMLEEVKPTTKTAAQTLNETL